MPAPRAKRLAVLCVCVLSPFALTACDNWNSDNRRDSKSLSRDPSTTDGSASDRSAREQTGRDQTGRDQMGREQRSTTGTNADARTIASGEEQRVLSLLQAKNAEEIDIGQLAQIRAQSREARALADRLVEDHSRSQLQIRDMASRMNMTILDANQVISNPQSDRNTTTPLARLRALNGAEFDRTFAQMMVEGHADLIAKVQSARQNVRNPQIAEFLDRQLKALQTHEQMARAIRN